METLTASEKVRVSCLVIMGAVILPSSQFPWLCGRWLRMMSIDVCCEIASGGGLGDFPVFAHPGLLIWASCSMAVAQGSWSAVWGCAREGHREPRQQLTVGLGWVGGGVWLRANSTDTCLSSVGLALSTGSHWVAAKQTGPLLVADDLCVLVINLLCIVWKWPTSPLVELHLHTMLLASDLFQSVCGNSLDSLSSAAFVIQRRLSKRSQLSKYSHSSLADIWAPAQRPTGGLESHDACIKNKPLHLITGPLSNWRSAVNILNNQCHPSPTPQAAAINPSCSGMPGLTKMVALLQTSFYNGCVELPPGYASTFK